MSELKFCKDCQWCSPNQSCEIAGDYTACIHPKSEKQYDLVDGTLIGFLSCALQRTKRKREVLKYCGPEGRWFEKKVIR